jgi:hypothetical protein
MGFNSASGFTSTQNVVVTGGVTLSKNTATVITGTRNSAGTTDVGTVGAGKTWRILSVQVSGAGGSSGQFTVLGQLNGITAVSCQGNSSATMGCNGHDCVTFSYDSCPILTQGQKVQLVETTSTAPACNAILSCTYVEE